ERVPSLETLLRAVSDERLLGRAAAGRLALELARELEVVALDAALVADRHRAVGAAFDRELEGQVVALEHGFLDRQGADELVLHRARELARGVDEELEHERERAVRRVDARVPFAGRAGLRRARQREQRERRAEDQTSYFHFSPRIVDRRSRNRILLGHANRGARPRQ